MTYEERKRYEDYRFNRHYDENMLNAARFVGHEQGREEGSAEGREEGLAKGREEGREEGFAEGHEKASKEIAQKMLKAGIDPAFIKEITGKE